ncbi:hypothetical protein ASG87_09090 [Frateuria sp. Soil773]|uniref:hypothetical protein n=1 Tax=Frateuria sp. Soil773 TaxID=1736407 RepID=UPI0006F3FAF4|nr:hypothetical protein [Frateuria sp. Soil773]KRE88715.1 hypothetical protein ASG87_09090 [Frateuria sp. Soil773]
MKPIPLRYAALSSAALAVLMVATRFKHFGDALHLPDASMAVFFLGGLYLRRHLAFVLFVALAVLLDWVSIAYAGVSDFCVTAAYAFLPLAYAVLWYAGRGYAGRLQATPLALAGAFGVAVPAAALSFAVSNGAFYWLGGRYAEPHVAEYAARLWQWGPLFVRTTLGYVAAALLLHGLLAWALRPRAAASHSRGR